jgi:hypothetical protein
VADTVQLRPLLSICGRAKSGSVYDMKTLQIVSQTDKAPFASDRSQPAQRELPESHDLFDDAKDRFNRALAQAIDGLACFRAQLVGHLDFMISVFWWWLWFALQERMQIVMMTITSNGNMGIDAHRFKRLDFGGAEVAIVHGRSIGPAQFYRDRLSCHHPFMFVIGMIGERIANSTLAKIALLSNK